MGVSDLIPIGAVTRIPQKQAGFFRIRLRLPAGDLTASRVSEIVKIAENYGRGEFRCTGRHELEVPFIQEHNLETVMSALERLGIRATKEGQHPNVVACPGSDHCPVAFAGTKDLCLEIETFLNKIENSGILPPEFRVAVSGCPNECSQTRVNDIGFIGTFGSYGGEKLQGFELVAGGSLLGAGRLATRIAFVSREDIIPTLRDVLGIYRKQASSGMAFHDFFWETGPAEFSMLLLQKLKQRMWFFQI